MVGKLMEKDKFNYFIKTEKNNWEVIIGLEVHAQVVSNLNYFLVLQPNLVETKYTSKFRLAFQEYPVINDLYRTSSQDWFRIECKINLNSFYEKITSMQITCYYQISHKSHCGRRG